MKTPDIARLGKTAVKFLDKNAPIFLAAGAIVSLAGAVVSAVKVTPKALMNIEEEKRSVNAELRNMYATREIDEPMQIERLTPLDTVRVTWKCYIPTALFTATSVACIISGTAIGNKRLAAAATACAISETAFREYKDKVKAVVGEKVEGEVLDAIAKDRIEETPVKEEDVVNTGTGTTLVFEPYSGRYFRGDIDYIKKSLNDLNHMLLFESHVNLNDFYEMLGLDLCKTGDMLGWHIDGGLVDIRLSSQLAAGNEPCIVIDFDKTPMFDSDRWI